MQTLRFADARTVHEYPLEIPGPIDWQASAHGYMAAIELPDLPAGSIIAPSLAVLDQPDYRFQFILQRGKHAYPLAPVPAHPGDPAGADKPVNPSDRHLRTAIDCFHLNRPLHDVRLIVMCHTDTEPQRYLLTVAMRPTEQLPESPPPDTCVRAPQPPSRSQMLENPRIAGGICSPMSTAMVLKLHDPGIDYGRVISSCFDPATRMYGMWPLAIHTASRYGLIGAVELFTDWAPVLTCLARGLPLVASIRYGRGELPGAPQPASGGHLVVVHGIEGDRILVNDPAAPNHGTVARRLPLAAFGRAWFRYRGAAYILSPCDT